MFECKICKQPFEKITSLTTHIQFQKHKLVAEGADLSLSEHEIMKQKKCPRIYDCGTLKFVLN